MKSGLQKAATIAVFFMLLATAHVRGAEPSRQLRVLCYNVHWCLGTDGKYDVARLAEVINSSKPDLVALQEVDVGVKRSGRIHEVQQLAKLTGLSARFGPTQHYEGGLFGNAVLSRFPILDVSIHPLPYSESTADRTTYPRGAIAVTVKAPDGQPLRFVSTHFQHNVHMKTDSTFYFRSYLQFIIGADTPDLSTWALLGVPRGKYLYSRVQFKKKKISILINVNLK